MSTILTIVLQGDRFGWALASNNHYREGGSERIHTDHAGMNTWVKNMVVFFKVNSISYSCTDTPKCKQAEGILKAEAESRDIDIEKRNINKKKNVTKLFPNAFVCDDLHGQAMVLLSDCFEAAA